MRHRRGAARRPPLDAHLEFFGIRPRFGADWERLELPRTLLDRVPRLANPPLDAYLERQLVSSLANRPPPAESISERVAQLLEQDLASREPGVATIASALATSERTLRRALQKERLTFRGLWQSVRRRRAEELLGAGRVTIDEAAFLIGFSETPGAPTARGGPPQAESVKRLAGSVSERASRFRQIPGVANPRDQRQRVSRCRSRPLPLPAVALSPRRSGSSPVSFS